MITLAAVAAAGLLAGLSADPAVAPAIPPDVTVEAGTVRWEGDANRYVLEDGVVVRRGLVTLRARTATLDVTTGEVQATGGALLTDATRAVSAEGIRALLGGAFEAEGVVAFLKEGPVELGRAQTLEEARRTGTNRVSFTGRKLVGDPDGRLLLQDARLTLCDCGGGAPSWEIRARRADVVTGERAVLSWPVLYVTPRFLLVNRPVPVLIVPWLYLPLGDRHTGLLFPSFEATPATGFTVAEPLFLTLGRSADATFTPEWMAGRAASSDRTKGVVRGLGARLELRWAPAEGAAGEVELHGVQDEAREAGGAGGGRLGVVGTHHQRLGDATHLQLDLALASDPVWFRDLTADVIQRSRTYERSDLLVSRRGDALVLELGAAYLEPLTPGGRPDGLAFGTFGADVPVFQRLPSISATLLPVDEWPVLVSGRLGLSRFASVSGPAAGPALAPGDLGAQQLTIIEGRYHLFPAVNTRAAVTRLDGRVEASVPLRAGGVVLEPYARGAAVGYSYDADRALGLAAWAVSGARVSAELSRSFGGVVHHVVPRLDVRGITGLGGTRVDPLLAASDAWDRVPVPTTMVSVAPPVDPNGSPAVVDAPVARTLTAAPEGALAQLRASVENRLEGRAGRLQLELGQDYDLRRGRFAETFVTGVAVHAPFTADVTARVLALDPRPYDTIRPARRSWLDDFTELRGGVSVADHRGDLLRASLLSIGPGASGVLMAGVDPLFDLRPAATCPIAQGLAGARGVVSGATIGYDAVVAARTLEENECGAGDRRIPAGQVRQHTFSFVWDSPCHCFLAGFVLRLNERGEYSSFTATLDLSRLAQRARVK